MQQHTNPWNIHLIFMDYMGYHVGGMAWVDDKAWTTMQTQGSGFGTKNMDETVILITQAT